MLLFAFGKEINADKIQKLLPILQNISVSAMTGFDEVLFGQIAVRDIFWIFCITKYFRRRNTHFGSISFHSQLFLQTREQQIAIEFQSPGHFGGEVYVIKSGHHLRCG
jgi:hypothetical protein